MDYTQLDDEALMRLIQRKDADALSVLYDRYHRLVFGIARNAVGEIAIAEEITQDVFLKLWNGADLYQAGLAKVYTWLTSIARHQSIDVLRSRGSRMARMSVEWSDELLETLADEHEIHQVVESALEQNRVRQAVAALPPDQQEALALAFFKGLTHNQIAETLNQPLGTVKTRIRLAMQKLRETLMDGSVG